MKKLLCVMVAASCIPAACRKQSFRDNVSPHDFLSAEHYDKLVVEVQYVKGYAPSDFMIDKLNAFLGERLNKPEGISFVVTEIESPGKPYLTRNDIVKVEKNHRTRKTADRAAAVYVFLADGDYAGDGGSYKTLGINYAASSMVIFEKTIRDYSGGLTQPPTGMLEAAVAEHEFGHVMGLVDNGTPMLRYHKANGNHCSAKDCLMYYEVETTNIVYNLLGGNIPALDDYCIDDLRANGGK